MTLIVPFRWKKRNWLTPWIKCKRAMSVWWPWRNGPSIYMPTKRRGDEDLISRTMRHELVHYGQWLSLGRIGFLRKYLTRKGRLDIEAEAYAASVRWYLERGQQTITILTLAPLTETFPVVIYYARALKRGYWLGATLDECAAAIRGHMNP